MGEITHLNCDVCKKQITSINDNGEVEAESHFDISRSKKEFEINDGLVEEVIAKRNEKMLRYLCEKCFLKILNESKTLGSLFFYKDDNKFIY